MHSPTRSIVLIGMMGAGKSSVGRALEKRTGLTRFDTDELVASRAGMSIPQIFAEKGEEWFRDLESAVLNEIRAVDPAVVVTGGGIILRDANVQVLKAFGFVVWLDADVQVLLERATRRRTRPLLQTEDPAGTLRQMLAARRPLYQAAADLRVDTTGLIHDEVVEVILTELSKQRANGLP